MKCPDGSCPSPSGVRGLYYVQKLQGNFKNRFCFCDPWAPQHDKGIKINESRKIEEDWEELFLESVFARLSLLTRKHGEITASVTSHQERGSKIFKSMALKDAVVTGSPNGAKTVPVRRSEVAAFGIISRFHSYRGRKSMLILSGYRLHTHRRKTARGHIRPCLLRFSRGTERFHQQRVREECGGPNDYMKYYKSHTE